MESAGLVHRFLGKSRKRFLSSCSGTFQGELKAFEADASFSSGWQLCRVNQLSINVFDKLLFCLVMLQIQNVSNCG